MEAVAKGTMTRTSSCHMHLGMHLAARRSPANSQRASERAYERASERERERDSSESVGTEIDWSEKKLCLLIGRAMEGWG